MPENRRRKRAGEKGRWEDGGRGEEEIERRRDGGRGRKRVGKGERVGS